MIKIKRVLRALFMVFYSPYCKFIRGYIINYDVVIDLNTKVSRNCKINSGNIIPNTQIGYGSYLGINNRLPNAVIGKFCCLAHNIELISSRHPCSDFVSFHPAFYSLAKQAGFTYTKYQKFDEHSYLDKENKVTCKIGNDVWVGANVIIMGGITIGDGAMIAAGSIVTKDVEPYSIVGGVPAKFIRYRFLKHEIAFLLKLQWWNKDDKWLKDNVNLFEDINLLMHEINENS